MNAYDVECSKSELDLVSMPPLNVSMERGEYVTHRPVSSMDSGGPLEFQISSTPDLYLDMGRSKLYLKLKIVKATGANVTDTDHVVPVNLLLHSLFSQVDVKMKDVLVTSSLNTYPYKAYLETLLAFGNDAKSSHKGMEGFYLDEAGGMEKVKDDDDLTNEGYDQRKELMGSNKTFELMGRLHADIFHQDRFILPGVDVSIKLIRSPDNFHLMINEGAFKVAIQEACFITRRVKINPTLALQHAKILQTGQFLKYPFRRGVVTTSVIAQGSISYHRDNLVSGQLPRRVVIGLVRNDAFNGTAKRNPFNFEHFDLNYLSLSTGSQNFPAQPLTPAYHEGLYLEAYDSLYTGLGYTNEDRSFCINRQQYVGGYTLYAVDLTADQCEGSHVDPIRYGDLKVEIHFKRALQTPVNLIVYSEYDSVLKIDGSRNVITDYNQ